MICLSIASPCEEFTSKQKKAANIINFLKKFKAACTKCNKGGNAKAHAIFIWVIEYQDMLSLLPEERKRVAF